MPSTTAFDHIAFALPRMADAVPFLVGVLGGEPHSGARGGPDFRFGTWRYANGGKLEVIEPIGEDGFVSRFLAARGPGVHHVTFKVPSLDEACDRAGQRGYDIVGYDDSFPDWKTAFLHPKQALGIVVQFAQTSGAGEPRHWTPPATVENPPPAVSVLGLRMRVSDPERARLQWEEILHGTCASRDPKRLVYVWPNSPMVLTIAVDPNGSEGPLSVELAADRPVTLPPGPVPALGTSFRVAQT
ncbi:MAG TPA: VOC family protein [Terriglobales bacterium]|nr:VOC family protein [Terriglobales bacterium]